MLSHCVFVPLLASGIACEDKAQKEKAREFASMISAPEQTGNTKESDNKDGTVTCSYWTNVCSVLDTMTAVTSKADDQENLTPFPKPVGSLVYAETSTRLKQLPTKGVDKNAINAVNIAVDAIAEAQRYYENKELSIAGSAWDGAKRGTRAFFTASFFGGLRDMYMWESDLSKKWRGAQIELDIALKDLGFVTGCSLKRARLD